MKYVLLDTNTFLHYQLFTEIDWCVLFDTEEVVILATTTVLQELDKKKFSEHDIKIRNRAKKVISTFNHVYENNITFKKCNTRLEFITTEPTTDWNKENLDSLMPDDRIIASCLDMKEKFNDFILVTADFGLKLIALQKSILVYELDNTYLINEKPTKEQGELLELREKIKKLEVTFPKLSLKFSGDSGLTDFISFEIVRKPKYPKDKFKKETDKKFNEILVVGEKKINQVNNFIINGIVMIRKEEIDDFNKKVVTYESDLMNYYQDLWEYDEFISRLLKIDFVFMNDGSSPGEDIDINIHFPDGFKVFGSKGVPRKPKEPKCPDPPMTMVESMRSYTNSNLLNLSYSSILNRPIINSTPVVKNFSGPSIKKTNSYEVDFHVNSLKHKSSHILDPIFVYFEKYSEVKSFSVDYNILAANYPEKFIGRLNIVVDMK